jgi:peroxidase
MKRRQRHMLLEKLETRRMLSSVIPVGEFRPIDEVGNNVANPTWGTAGDDLLRLAPTNYADGVDAPALPDDLSARDISNILNNQSDPSDPSQDLATLDANELTDFGYVFGQFMDHDMDNTPTGDVVDNIAVSPGDPIGPAALPFTRSITDPSTGTSTSNPTQQPNEVTSYLDLSQIYGSDQATADALRTFSGGQLKTSAGNMLPYLTTNYFTAAQLTQLNAYLGGEQNQGPLSMSSLFATGDIRGNENLELTALQTLFLRNHNMIASQLQADHPNWSDEQLYQTAREINIAQYQSIVYNEWIPAVFGASAMPAYTGYNPSTDAAIANEFSTVAFRFGHSLLSEDIARDGNNGQSVADDVPLSEDFFDPNLLNPADVVDPFTGETSTDIDAVLKGDADGISQASDLLAVSDVRDLLFGNAGAGGQDLIALDIQRGRDHGIATYNQLRVAMGLPAVTSFSQITSNVAVQQELEQAYPGGVNTIDAFEGGLAEDHVAGSDVGPLFQAIMINQFERLRDGDRFFYLNESFTPEMQQIFSEGDTLTKVIENNTSITNLQSDIFKFSASISGTVYAATGRGDFGRGSSGMSGITVELEDTDGDVLATTTTDRSGRYSFDQNSGPSDNPDIAPGINVTGTYDIVVEYPAGIRGLTADSTSTSASVSISRSGINVDNMNFDLGTGGVAQGHSCDFNQFFDGTHFNDDAGSMSVQSMLNDPSWWQTQS